MEFCELTSLISEGNDLSREQAEQAAAVMAATEVSADAKAAFLVALAAKGEVADEVAGFAGYFRSMARNPGLEAWSASAIDVCGTGGDKQNTFNISTTVTFVAAAAGIPVLKHGNRSITSKCGSANLLDALGVDLMADDATLALSMKELGFCFMFAPAFHPAFKEIMPVRQALAEQGKRTIFNVLGPLINPAKPAYQLLGVPVSGILGIMSDALEKVGLSAACVAHCELGDRGGMDEFSVAGKNLSRSFGAGLQIENEFEAESLGLKSGALKDLEGGDITENLNILDRLLDGKAPKALEDTVVLNAAMALHVAGNATQLSGAIEEARELLLGGATRRKIEQTKEFYKAL